MGLQQVLRGAEARGILFCVLQARHAEPHVRRGLVDADAGRCVHPTTAQAACKAEDPRQDANIIPSFGRKLRKLFVTGCWLRTAVIADHLG
jgi:hypothetical protein